MADGGQRASFVISAFYEVIDYEVYFEIIGLNERSGGQVVFFVALDNEKRAGWVGSRIWCVGGRRVVTSFGRSVDFKRLGAKPEGMDIG